MLRIAVVGVGTWGVNHVRVFARAQACEVACICDPSDEALARASRLAPRAILSKQFEDVLNSTSIDAVVLATPAVTHAEMSRAALEAGKHVFVEKPLAMSAAEARQVVASAERAGRVLMVGHLMLYHPAVERLRDMVASGILGEIYYLYSIRVNLGRLRRDENALWSLAPHDVSMILHLLKASPVSVSARGGAYLQRGIQDVVFVNLRFHNGVNAQIQVSWLDPRKERRLTIVGSKKMVEFDDVHPVEKLRIYDKGYDRPPQFTEYAEYLQIRNGDIHIPRVPLLEPLEAQSRHFLECVAHGRKPLTDGASAVRVVEVLEAAQQSLDADGTPVEIGR